MSFSYGSDESRAHPADPAAIADLPPEDRARLLDTTHRADLLGATLPSGAELVSVRADAWYLGLLPARRLRETVDAARASGIVLLDCPDRSEVAREGEAALRDVLPVVDLFLPSTSDAATFLPGVDENFLPSVFHDWGSTTVVLKCGSGAVLVSGGTTGVMAAASRGVREAGGLTIGFLPEADRSRASAYVDVAFPTGMGMIRNLLTPRVCDAVIMIGGGAGTLNELTIAYDFGTPVVAVAGTGGWADRIRPALQEERWLDERRTVELSFAAGPEDAVAVAVRRAAEPRRFTTLPVHIGSAAD